MSNRLEAAVAGAVEAVLKALGPGKREMNYEVALAHELTSRGVSVDRQASTAGEDLRADLIVGGEIAIFIYSIEPVTYDHAQRIKRYLGASGLRDARLLDFNQDTVEGCITVFRR